MTRPLGLLQLLFAFFLIGHLGFVAPPARAQGQQPTPLDRADMHRTGLQRRFVEGKVHDADSNQPIMNAHVILLRGGLSAGETLTDDRGGFFFRDLVPGDYELEVSVQGYFDQRESVSLTAMSLPNVYVYLRSRGLQRPPVVIEPLSAEDEQAPKEARKEFEKGVELMRERRLSEARARLEKAITLYPRFASAYSALGRVLMAQDLNDEAQRAFEAANEIHPNLAVSRLFLGGLYNAGRRYADAVIQLKIFLALQPSSGVGHFEISRSYWGLKDVDNAEEHINRAHELEPRLAQIHLMRANVLVVRQKPTEALSEIDEFLKLQPTGPLADYVRSQREKLQAKLTPAN